MGGTVGPGEGPDAVLGCQGAGTRLDSGAPVGVDYGA